MDFLTKILLVLCLVASFTSNTYGDDCVKSGPCSCKFANGTGIDLTGTNKSTFFTATNFVVTGTTKEYELHTYYYHPCYDLVPPVTKNSPNDTCDKPLTLCRHISTFKPITVVNKTETYEKDGLGVSNYLGDTNSSTFSADGASIIYSNSPSVLPTIESIVLLFCAETEDRLLLGPNSLADPAKIVLMFYSRSACLKTMDVPDEGRSFGSTLMIIFFSLVIFYLVLGVFTKKFLMGATGIEVIPNLGFWSDLPNLVKDGWAFSINGFKLPARGPGPVSSPDPNSYDSI